MKEESCILCGQPFPTGLHVMGCLICFPCEKRLLWSGGAFRRRAGLRRLFDGGGANSRTAKG